MKKCNKCNEIREGCEYQKDSSKADGLRTICKICCKEYEATKRNSTNSRKKENIDNYQKRYRDNNKEAIAESQRRYLKNPKNRKKHNAHWMVFKAKESGKLSSEPCEICGSERSVAHHDDYDKPLNVRWLCQSHHKQWHAVNGEGKNSH